MKTFYWLVKREFWEHRGGFLWTPLICAAMVIVLNVIGMLTGSMLGSGFWGMWQQWTTGSPEDMRNTGAILDIMTLMPGFIVSIGLFVALFSYGMKCLSADRTDRSILFWKSLPISDLATVLSKAFSAVIVAPIIAVIVSAVSAVLILLTVAIAAAMQGIDFGLVMWTLPHTGRVIGMLFGLLPVYMVWMLPAVAWLMLCSAWTSGRTARWALGVPFGLGAIVYWLAFMAGHSNVGSWFWQHIVMRIPFGIFPAGWAAGNGTQVKRIIRSSSDSGVHMHGMDHMFSHAIGVQYHLLLTPDFLWGALVGIIMIGIAVWLRRWRTEL